MAEVTFQVLEGMERGRIFALIETPFTVGREEDNSIQLNDERVSRFHLKIQEDDGRVILTDLDSTNGTRVNGAPAQLRVLQFGDLIAVGRCVLVFGSPEEIARRFRSTSSPAINRLKEVVAGSDSESDDDDDIRHSATMELGSAHPSDWSDMLDAASQDMASNPPTLPETFSLGQRAQLTDLIAFLHHQILQVLSSGREPSMPDSVGCRLLDGVVWHQLVNLELQLSQMLRGVSNPDAEQK
ncbi:MAG: FHA domain-containing protein [Planctomycetia bacterium]|nr:FHA domain-containing protein [Planctomycetia bacterium]